MSVPASVVELVSLIRKSGVIDEHKLNDYLQRRQDNGDLSADVRECTDDIVSCGLMTYFRPSSFCSASGAASRSGSTNCWNASAWRDGAGVPLRAHVPAPAGRQFKVLPPAKAEQGHRATAVLPRGASAALDHANVVRTHDIDQDGNLHFLVMDYVDGPACSTWLSESDRWTMHRAINYVRQIGARARSRVPYRVIHRDVKPGNILDRSYRRARLLDIGLARFSTTDDDSLRSGTTTNVCSARPIMSPRSRS